MIFIFMSLVNMVFGTLANLFPSNPFAEVLQVTSNMALGLSWLNWFIPVNQMFAVMVLWLAAIALVTAVRVALVGTTKFSLKTIFGKS